MKKPETIVKEVVKQLVTIRKEQGLSHETVATRAGIHRSTVSLIEAGKRQPTLLTLLKIAQALKCDFGDVFKKIGSS